MGLRIGAEVVGLLHDCCNQISTAVRRAGYSQKLGDLRLRLDYIVGMGMLREFAAVSAAALGAMCLAVLLLSTLERAVSPPAHAKIAIAKPPPARVASTPTDHPLPVDAVARAPLAPRRLAVDPTITDDAASAVADRLASKVPPSLTPYFDVYLYVSKAPDSAGPWGQKLFYFRKTASGTLAFVETIPVSTGREEDEQYFTATPMGLFELDSSRFMAMAYSAKWNDAEMPWAMFLNYAYRTGMTGVALHAAIGARELRDIGHRASGGCVRLPLEKADQLFHRFQAEEKGWVPVFTFDEARGTTNVQGNVAGDGAGHIYLADGMRVLVVIENYSGHSRQS